jgi:Zn-dependent protease
MAGSFRIARIAGIDIDINISWLIILALLTASLALSWFPAAVPHLPTATYWLLGLGSSLLLFASVLLHELAHSVVARSRGLPVSSITLFIFGGVSNLEQEPQSAGTEFFVAIVGPLTSLVIGVVALVLDALFVNRAPIAAAVCAYLGIVNLLLALFNLIPGFPLDGGRVLRSIIWGITGNLRTATRWAAGIGQFVAYLLIFYGILQLFTSNVLNGIWFAFIGWFMLNAAQSANRQVALDLLLRGVHVADVLRPVPLTVPAESTLQEVVDHTLLPNGLRMVPVMQGDQFVGLLTLADVRHIPRERWPQTPASSVMIPLERLHVVAPQQDLSDVLRLMAGQDINQVLVVQDGKLVGAVSRDAIVNFLDVRQSLGAGGATSSASREAAAQPSQHGGLSA